MEESDEDVVDDEGAVVPGLDCCSVGGSCDGKTISGMGVDVTGISVVIGGGGGFAALMGDGVAIVGAGTTVVGADVSSVGAGRSVAAGADVLDASVKLVGRGASGEEGEGDAVLVDRVGRAILIHSSFCRGVGVGASMGRIAAVVVGVEEFDV